MGGPGRLRRRWPGPPQAGACCGDVQATVTVSVAGSSAAPAGFGTGALWNRLITPPTIRVTRTPRGTSHCAAMAVGTVPPAVVTSILTLRTTYVMTPTVTRKAITASISFE